MPYAVTHILFPILIAAIYRDYFAKTKFPLHYVLLAGLGGVLPDIDIPISLFISLILSQDIWLHKTITHSLLFPLGFLILFLILNPINANARICNLGKHNLKLGFIFLSISLGTLTHILLDGFFGNQAFLLYPFSLTDFGINILQNAPFNWNTIMATIDGILLVVWILYLEIKHKISDFV
jgi:hypothetical protein